MAFTVSSLAKTVHGNQRVEAYRVTADAAEGTLVTGLKNIDMISVALQSASTAAIKMAMNELTSGTAAAGTVAVTGAVSGDELIVTAYGH